VLTAAGIRHRVLSGVDISVDAGELVVLVGPSGSGKSTLLAILFGLEAPAAGSVAWAVEAGRWGRVALVPQDLGLLPELPLRENVALPALLDPELATTSGTRDVDELLERLDLVAVAARLPDETSLGEQQRAAVARALLLRPAAVLADEPTSHQDATRADLVVTALRAAAVEGAAVLVSSHEPDVVAAADRIVELGAVATG
jgi:putative ABC transport system ATP-binding protein